MKYCLLVFFWGIIVPAVSAQNKQKEEVFLLPDSVKASGLYAEVLIQKNGKPRKIKASMQAGTTNILLQLKKGKKQVRFEGAEQEQPLPSPQHVKTENNDLYWEYDWEFEEKYKLLLLSATDTVGKFSIVSGYIYLPQEKKWKLIGTQRSTDINPFKSTAISNSRKRKYTAVFSNRWLLRTNNTWKAIDSGITTPPVLRPMQDIDSLMQYKAEEDVLRSRLPPESVQYKDGVFYQLLNEGNGRPVNGTDTVVVHYKGWLFSNGEVFDATKEKPATFPLQRLIRGWQVGLPQCKVGGKIRLYIPSGSAYGIRTFATSIPPNNTLVFDVEVVDTKEKNN
jgi:FKBP-type peptidyl-prolyl cis-trans isomerase FkpA